MLIEYDIEIYPVEIIKKAIADYNGIADIELILNKNLAVCYFKKFKYDELLTCNEFSNYLIDLLNQVQI